MQALRGREREGVVNSADYSAWIIASNTNDPLADQNQDGSVTLADFNAFIVNLNQGTNGPFCPGYSAGCPDYDVLFTEGLLAPNPSAAVPVGSADLSAPTPTRIDRGSVVDIEFADADALADLVSENRLIAGDDHATNPPAGQVDRVREEYQLGAVHIIDEHGNDVFATAMITRFSFSRISESTGIALIPTIDVTDAVEFIGRYQSFADAQNALPSLVDLFDLEVENPDETQFPEYGPVIFLLDAPDEVIYNADTGEYSDDPGPLINCNGADLNCSQTAICLYRQAVRNCISAYNQDVRDAQDNGLLGGGAACALAGTVCGALSGGTLAVPCCAVGFIAGQTYFSRRGVQAAVNSLGICTRSAGNQLTRDLGACP